jgi:parvulin-like peptidyl-prolyl isomerase
MTSPTDPPRTSIRDRISHRLSTDSSGRYIDAEARHTRNVTWLFVLLIGAVALVAVAGLAYGFYESNLKPLANVDGTQVGRGEWEDRQRLKAFRLDRAESVVTTALADGSLDPDLANRRLTVIASERESAPSADMEELVDLLFQEQLAAERDIVLSEDDIAAALAADGTQPEARRVEALVVTSTEQQIGLPPTPQGQADARAAAEEALAQLQEGTPVADLVEEYSPATADTGGDLGYIAEGDINEPTWTPLLFALEEGGITEIVEAATGELLIGVVTDIVPEAPDPGFLDAIDEAVGSDVHRRNIELEALAAKLEDQVIAETIEAEYEQVKLAEILIEGDTFVDPGDDEGSVRSSHILYQPEAVDDQGVAIAVADIAEDDPAWAEAQAEAEQAAAELREVDEVDARAEAFASRAQADGDDNTAAAGGDLGYYTRDGLVAEFADVLFDAEDPQFGDILGPVRTQFGWHVIMYNELRPPLAERVEAVEAALAEPGADFAAVAAEYSDGPEALSGGEIGWQVTEDLDEVTALALTAIDIGETTLPVDGDRGFTIYQKLDEATRPLEPAEAAQRGSTAFLDWYDEQRFGAEADGRISIDGSVYEETQRVPTHGG